MYVSADHTEKFSGCNAKTIQPFLVQLWTMIVAFSIASHVPCKNSTATTIITTRTAYLSTSDILLLDFNMIRWLPYCLLAQPSDGTSARNL